jgi:hypothetical protein
MATDGVADELTPGPPPLRCRRAHLITNKEKLASSAGAAVMVKTPWYVSYFKYDHDGAGRRRSGVGGPEEGYARMPVGIYLYLHAVGAGNHVVVW